MTTWLLNSAVIAVGAHGTYRYAPATWADAAEALKGGATSRIGYAETADLIERQTGLRPTLSREGSALAPGDVAYVVRLPYRVDPTVKGAPTGVADDEWEVARLERLAEPPADEVRLDRTGEAPLAFRGSLVAEAATGKWWQGVEQNRWHEVAVYRTAAGRYVLAVRYRTLWQGEADRARATVHRDVAGVEDELYGYPAAEDAAGLGHLARMSASGADKAQRIGASLEGRFAEAVSRVLGALGVEERVE